MKFSFSQRQIIVNYPSKESILLYASSSLFLPGNDIKTRKWNSAIKKIIEAEEFSSLVSEQSVIIPLSFHILSIQ
jgi:hypothetical protein